MVKVVLLSISNVYCFREYCYIVYVILVVEKLVFWIYKLLWLKVLFVECIICKNFMK